jgi:hypothetical protein
MDGRDPWPFERFGENVAVDDVELLGILVPSQRRKALDRVGRSSMSRGSIRT